MFWTWLQRPLVRIALIAGGLMFVLSGCHLHHGHVRGGFGYSSGGHYGGYERGYRDRRDGHRRGHRRGGWRGGGHGGHGPRGYY